MAQSSSSRSQVASSFTIIKGAMIEETYAVFSQWDFDESKRENLDRLRRTNYIGASSATWLRDVAKVLNRRFEPAGRDRPLVLLAQQGFPMEEWKPLLLWHLTRDEFLLRNFLTEWLYEEHESGVFRIKSSDAEAYLRTIEDRGALTEHEWSDQTTRRVAVGLLNIATSFGVLRGSIVREFSPYHLPERSFLYLLYALRDEKLNPARIVNASDWRLFLMRPSDVEHELLHLHQYRKLEFHVAGSLMELSLPFANALEYVARLAS